MWIITFIVIVALSCLLTLKIPSISQFLDRPFDPDSPATRIREALSISSQNIKISRKKQKLIESLFAHSQYMHGKETSLEHKAMSKTLDSVGSWEVFVDCVVLSPFVFYSGMLSDRYQVAILLDDSHKKVDGDKIIYDAFEMHDTSTSVQVDPDISDQLIVEFLESFFRYYHEQIHQMQLEQSKQASKRLLRVKNMMPSLGRCPNCDYALEVDPTQYFVSCNYCHSDLVDVGDGLERLTPMHSVVFDELEEFENPDETEEKIRQVNKQVVI